MYRGDTSIYKLVRIGRWSEPRFVCQLVEVIREADANETSGELGLALPGNLVFANSRFLGLVSVWAARSFDQTALRPSLIKRIRQIDVNT